jgi:uncharacterized protein YdaU (DUF1376 family)
MAKQPTLPLYYNDIARTTSTWTDEEFGCYMRLLMEQWDKGSLPNDYQRLTRLATSLDKNWNLIKPKFKEMDGVLINVRMEEIRENIKKHSKKQSDNVRKRYQTSTKLPTKNVPLEDEYENENSINEKGKTKEMFFADHKILEYTCKQKGIGKDAGIVLMQKFWDKQEAANEITTRTFSDFRKHYMNWVDKQKIEPFKQSVLSNPKLG